MIPLELTLSYEDGYRVFLVMSAHINPNVFTSKDEGIQFLIAPYSLHRALHMNYTTDFCAQIALNVYNKYPLGIGFTDVQLKPERSEHCLWAESINS